MRTAALLLGVVCAASACNKKPRENQGLASASAAVSAAAEAEPVRKAEPPPPDVEPTSLAEDLGCKEEDKTPICRIMAEFAEGKPWKAKTPSGLGVWIGNAYQIGKPDAEGQLYVLRAKTVPTARVGPSDLPIMVGFEPLPEEHHPPAAKLVRALMRGGQGKITNPVLPVLERFEPKQEYGAMQSKGASVRLIADDTVYLRQLSLKKVALVSLKAASPGSHDVEGIVAEMWSAVW